MLIKITYYKLSNAILHSSVDWVAKLKLESLYVKAMFIANKMKPTTETEAYVSKRDLFIILMNYLLKLKIEKTNTFKRNLNKLEFHYFLCAICFATRFASGKRNDFATHLHKAKRRID